MSEAEELLARVQHFRGQNSTLRMNGNANTTCPYFMETLTH